MTRVDQESLFGSIPRGPDWTVGSTIFGQGVTLALARYTRAYMLAVRPLGPNWRDHPSVKRAIRMSKDRAGYKCKRCGLRPKDRGFLHAHHLVSPPRYGGSTDDLGNLKVLCELCHILAEGKTPSAETEARWAAGGSKPPPRESVKHPGDWEGLSLDEQADRVRAHLRSRSGPIVASPPSRRRRRGPADWSQPGARRAQ